MTTGQRVPLPAPPPTGPILSLVGSAIDPAEGQGDGPWTKGFAYAPENHRGPVARAVCDFTTADVPALSTTGQTAPTLTPSSGGSLAAGTVAYRVSILARNGETVPGPEATVVVTAGQKVTLTWPAWPDAVSYRIYGRTQGSEQLLGGSTTTTYTDTGAGTPSGAMPTQNTTGGPGQYGNLPNVNFDPVMLQAWDRCSSFGFGARDYKGRATRLLEAATPYGVEAEFWSGALAQAAGFTQNNYLTAGTVVDLTPAGGPVSITRGREILEDALAAAVVGQGMIHCQPQCAPQLYNARRVGSRLLTQMDTVIVPGSGYPGTGPGGVVPSATTSWMYATDMVTVRLGTIHAYPESFEEALDRQSNDLQFYAERAAAATFDGAAQFAVHVTLDT